MGARRPNLAGGDPSLLGLLEYDPRVHRIVREGELLRWLARGYPDAGMVLYRHEITGNFVIARWAPVRGYLQELLVVGPLLSMFGRAEARVLDEMMRVPEPLRRKELLRRIREGDAATCGRAEEEDAEFQSQLGHRLRRMKKHRIKESPELRALAGMNHGAT